MDQVVAQSLTLFEKLTQFHSEKHINGEEIFQKA
jgi:hypothetical protein